MSYCIFCENGNLSTEHLWGKWLLRVSGLKSTPSSKVVHTTSLWSQTAEQEVLHAPEVRSGIFSKNGIDLLTKRRIVCRECNNGWMSKLENDMRSVSQSSFKQKVLSRNLLEADILPVWCTLKASMITTSVILSEDLGKPFQQALLEFLTPISHRQLPTDVTVGVCQLSSPFEWGWHNLSYALNSGRRPDFFFAGAVGPLGFWVTNSQEARQKLIELHLKAPSYIRIASSRHFASANGDLNSCYLADLEVVLKSIMGDPKIFRTRFYNGDATMQP